MMASASSSPGSQSSQTFQIEVIQIYFIKLQTKKNYIKHSQINNTYKHKIIRILNSKNDLEFYFCVQNINKDFKLSIQNRQFQLLLSIFCFLIFNFMNKLISCVLIFTCLIVGTINTCPSQCAKCDANPAQCQECSPGYEVNPSTKLCDVDYTKQGDWPGSCKAGTKQSPIDITTKDVKLCPPSKEFYNVYSGQNININPAGQNLKSTYGDQSNIEYITGGADLKEFSSAQFHWHHPSEHTLNGEHLDLQLHIVHTNKADSTKLSVAGFLFKVDPNIHTDIFDRFNFFDDGKDHPFSFPFDVRNRMAYHYQGSLTTPTCDEVVDWFVYADYWPITKRNFNKMLAKINNGHQNSRNTNALNGRIVELMGSFCNTYAH